MAILKRISNSTRNLEGEMLTRDVFKIRLTNLSGDRVSK